MRNLKRLLSAFFVLVLATITLFFVLENQQSVALTLFGWVAPSVPVAVVVMLALLVGMAAGPLLGFYVAARAKRRLRRFSPNP